MNQFLMVIQVGAAWKNHSQIINQSTYRFNDIGQDSDKIHKNILTCFLQIQASKIYYLTFN